MSDSQEKLEEVLTLANASLTGQASDDEIDRLEQLVLNDDEACRLYVDAMFDAQQLRRWASKDLHPTDLFEADSLALSFDARPTDGGPLAQEEQLASTLPVFNIFGSTMHGMVGFFSQEIPFSLLIATLVTCMGLLAGSFIYVSHHQQLANDASRSAPAVVHSDRNVAQSDIEFVGRVTGMVDAQWADAQTATVHGANVSLGRKYALASGLMEITYDTGARVILQGPVTYKVDSRDSGFLSLGKLTTRLEKGNGGKGGLQQNTNSDRKQPQRALTLALSQRERGPDANSQSLIPAPSPLFTIKTPTATVTDLGTEFGVEVSKDGQNRLHVFQGKVLLESRGSAVTASPKYELTAGESADVEPEGRVVRHSKHAGNIAAGDAGFVRSVIIPEGKLVAYWPMNEGSGRGAFDRSSNHINSYIVGETRWTEGRFGRAITFAQPGDCLNAVTDPKLGLGAGDFTISLWFRGPDSGKQNGEFRFLFDYNGYGMSKDSPALIIATASGTLRIAMGDWHTDQIPSPLGPKATVFNDTDWYNIALVRKDAVVTAYVNGVPEVSARKPIDLGDVHSLWLGASPDHNYVFEGAIDDVAIWKQALTAAQIKALAQGTATPLTVLILDSPQPDKNAKAKSSDDSGNRKAIKKGGGA